MFRVETPVHKSKAGLVLLDPCLCELTLLSTASNVTLPALDQKITDLQDLPLSRSQRQAKSRTGAEIEVEVDCEANAGKQTTEEGATTRIPFDATLTARTSSHCTKKHLNICFGSSARPQYGGRCRSQHDTSSNDRQR